MGVTEPSTGTDTTKIKTTAVRKGGGELGHEVGVVDQDRDGREEGHRIVRLSGEGAAELPPDEESTAFCLFNAN